MGNQYQDKSRQFRENLRRYRKSMNISQEEMGKRIGKKKSVVGSYENGNSEPTLSTLLKISDCIGVPVGRLIGEEFYHYGATESGEEFRDDQMIVRWLGRFVHEVMDDQLEKTDTFLRIRKSVAHNYKSLVLMQTKINDLNSRIDAIEGTLGSDGKQTAVSSK